MKSVFAITLLFALAASVLAAPTSSFLIKNRINQDLGAVTVNSNNGTSATINIPGKGHYTITIPGRPISVVINGQIILRHQEDVEVMLPSGKMVMVSFSDDEIIVATCQQEAN